MASTTEIDCPTILEAKNQGVGISGVSPFWGLWHRICSLPFPCFCWFAGNCNSPWLTDTSPWPLSSSSHGFLLEWVCLCLNSPLYKDASHVGLRFQCDLILTNHLCSDPVFKQDQILGDWVLELQHKNLQGGCNSPNSRILWIFLKCLPVPWGITEVWTVRATREMNLCERRNEYCLRS